MKETLTREHEDFCLFCNMLGEAIENKGCTMSFNRPNATAILERHFPNIDIEKTLEYFQKNGGYCDCEIMFNVACDPLPSKKESAQLLLSLKLINNSTAK